MFEPKIIAYLCTWCSYTGADTAGIARLKSPANLRAVRVPCSGRVSPEIIMRTFDEGADGVLVLGCHIGECHYDSGNHRTANRLPLLRVLMSFAGLEPERLRLDWVSASEGERFSRIVTEFNDIICNLGPARYRANRWRPEPQETQCLQQDAPAGAGAYNCLDHSEWASREAALRENARELLAAGRVRTVIGYERSPRGRVRPVFVHHPEDANRLVWNPECSQNLTVYISDELTGASHQPGAQTAVVVKPCDSRAIHVQLAEGRYNREQVHVIGVTCEGMHKGDGHKRLANGAANYKLQKRCQVCSERTPLVFDQLIGGAVSIEPHEANPYLAVEALDALTSPERMEFWLSQFDRCLRCYACRQACPLCDCPICLYERDDSLWVGPSTGWDGVGLNEKRTFHLGRAFHLAGRCIGCDECERACPVGIPISYLNRKIAEEVRYRFGHVAGLAAVPSPIVTVLSGEEDL